MAWQSPSAMAGGGGFTGSAGDGGSNGGHPQGTEYTLQGEWSWRILQLCALGFGLGIANRESSCWVEQG